ncbi:bacteriocin-like protein [Chryseobacterium tongliaoense]|uniref:bacteriocin-like protein n=1 Tax=Chryseobacterium tongliaoense TaxID=3240933 RepID=UPI003F7B012D
MKNLKRLSRNELKPLTGGIRFPEGVDGCKDMCKPTMGVGTDTCQQYGLTCGWWMDSNGNSCNRCM